MKNHMTGTQTNSFKVPIYYNVKMKKADVESLITRLIIR